MFFANDIPVKQWLFPLLKKKKKNMWYNTDSAFQDSQFLYVLQTIFTNYSGCARADYASETHLRYP